MQDNRNGKKSKHTKGCPSASSKQQYITAENICREHDCTREELHSAALDNVDAFLQGKLKRRVKPEALMEIATCVIQAAFLQENRCALVNGTAYMMHFMGIDTDLITSFVNSQICREKDCGDCSACDRNADNDKEPELAFTVYTHEGSQAIH